MPIVTRTVAGVVLAAVLAGCSSSPNTVEGTQPSAQTQKEATGSSTPQSASGSATGQPDGPSGQATSATGAAGTAPGPATSSSSSSSTPARVDTEAYWNNQTYPNTWMNPPGGTVSFTDGVCVGGCSVSIKDLAINVDSAGRGSAVVVLFGHDGEGWPLQQFVYLYDLAPGSAILAARGEASLADGQNLCVLAAALNVDGGVSETFSACGAGYPDSGMVWRRDGRTLTPA